MRIFPFLSVFLSLYLQSFGKMTQKSNRAIIPRPCMKVKGQQIRRGGGEGLCAVQVAAWTCDRMQDAGRGGGGWRIREEQQQRWRRLLQGFKSQAGDLKGSFTGQISCHPITDCSLPRDQREGGGRAVSAVGDVEGQTSAASPPPSCSDT